MHCWRLLSSLTNVQLDLPEVEHEHPHLEFSDICEGKPAAEGVAAMSMDGGSWTDDDVYYKQEGATATVAMVI
jgi:hypothetical protein